MLLNLSNHPFSSWETEQITTAIDQFDRVADLEFPAIDPVAGSDEIKVLASSYAEKCIEMLANEKIKAVHIMGELTFTFAVISFLQKACISCFASTTSRNVIQMENNGKQSIFRFVQFREYPQI